MFDFDVVTGPTQPPQLPAELSDAATVPAPPVPDVQAKEPAQPQ